MPVQHPAACVPFGYTITECLIVVGLVLASSAVVSPVTATVVDAHRARQAAGFIASQFRLAARQAAVTGSSHGVVFDLQPGGWTFRVCVDGNGNGVRRSELGSIDVCAGDPMPLGYPYPGVRLACDPATPDAGGQVGSSDPVRFGASDIATFTPDGTATSGTLYMMSDRGQQYAVRVAGVTSRTRVLRFNPGSGDWRGI